MLGPGVLGRQVHMKAWRCDFIFFRPLMSLKLGNITIKNQTHTALSACSVADYICSHLIEFPSYPTLGDSLSFYR